MKQFLIFFPMLFLTSCLSDENQEINKDSSLNSDVYYHSFDISPNDSTIIAAVIKDNNHEIYEIEINTRRHRLLHSENDSVFFVNPRFSASNKKYLLIGVDKKNETNDIYIVENGNYKKVYSAKKPIVEAIFSFDYKKIYFTMADSYENYSPFARKSLHNYSVYFLDLVTNTANKLFNETFYGISGITDIDDEYFVARVDGPKEGIYRLKKKTKERERLKIDIPGAINSLYCSPVFSTKYKKLIFDAVYQMYSVDENMRYELLDKASSNDSYSNIRFFNHSECILFDKTDEFGEKNIYKMELSTKRTTKIPIIIGKKSITAQ